MNGAHSTAAHPCQACSALRKSDGPANPAQASDDLKPTTSVLTATTLTYAIGAGITAGAGTRLVLQLLLERLFTTNPFELPTKRQAFICPLTPSSIAQGERCAPAAFLRSVSNLSGPLSRIEPLSSVPVVTIACPLRCRLVDRSEAHRKSCSGQASAPPKESFHLIRCIAVKTCTPSC